MTLYYICFMAYDVGVLYLVLIKSNMCKVRDVPKWKSCTGLQKEE